MSGTEYAWSEGMPRPLNAIDERACPHCGEPITDTDTVCPHCGESLVGG